MVVPHLPLVVKACAMDVLERLPALQRGAVRQEEMLHFCGLYRRMGIGALFITGMPEELFTHLQRSGRAFLSFWQHAPEEDKATGRAAPFFDALACGDDEGARLIVQHARRTWHPGAEYEEEFLYMFFLMATFAGRLDRDALAPLLARYEAVLDGYNDPRLPLCRALQEGDAGAFEAALEDWVAAEDRAMREALLAETMPPDDVVTTAKLSVEGLALVRLARLQGLPAEPNHLLLPSVARLTGRARLPAPDAWMTLR